MNLLLTDTIGFDDNRFEPVELTNEIKALVYASNFTYSHILLVIPNGRITDASRIYLRLLEEIFSD